MSYVIDGTEPLEVSLSTFGTGKVSEEKIAEIIPKVFNLSPDGIIKEQNLLKPIYRKTSTYGNFWEIGSEFTWKKTNKFDQLKSYF